jgi:SAM-dependent methyltransferase
MSERRRIADFWDAHAASFDAEPDHGLRDEAMRAAWAERLDRWLPPAPALIVDAGCGTGSLARLAAAAGHRVVGIDVSAGMIQAARAKLAGSPGVLGLAVGDASDPPIATGIADVILVRHLVWTLPDPHRALRNWVELLRPGGGLVLVEGRWASPDGPTEPYVRAPMPWAGGVSAAELHAALAPLVARAVVEPLPDANLWGREIDDERYAVIAHR